MINLLPPRVPIGRALDSSGKQIDVLATPEFLRALSGFLDRIGGANGLSTADLELLAVSSGVTSGPQFGTGLADFMLAESTQAASAADTVGRQIADLQAQLDSVQGLLAQISEVAKSIQALEMAGGEFLMQYAQADSTYVKISTKDKPGGVLGLTATSGIQPLGGFGCNGKSAQPAYVLGPAATDLPTVITLANNIRAALIANGIGS